ncbi:MAG: hypothetical protein ACK4V6_02400 [Microthrixaceae bacterium]
MTRDTASGALSHPHGTLEEYNYELLVAKGVLDGLRPAEYRDWEEPAMSEVAVEYIDSDESWRIFDERARAELDISGGEFLERWNRGDYAGVRDSRVMKLALLRPASAR